MGKIFASVTPSERFAWPGGYPLFYVLERRRVCDVVCAECATIARAEQIRERDTFDPIVSISAHANFEDPELYCDHCYERIESAYTIKEGGR